MRESALIEDSVIEETAKHFGYYYVTIRRGIDAGLIKPYPLDLIGGILDHNIIAAMDQVLAAPDPARRDQLSSWASISSGTVSGLPTGKAYERRENDGKHSKYRERERESIRYRDRDGHCCRHCRDRVCTSPDRAAL